MTRKGLLRHVSRGRYLVVGPGGGELQQEASAFGLLDAALRPRRYAVSFMSALAHYGLTDHEPEELTILLDAPRGLSAPGQIAGMGVRAHVVRRDDRWFGIRTEIDDGGRYQIADPERAIIDSLDRPGLAGGPELVVRSLARGILNNDLRIVRLLRYANQHSVRLTRRLGFLLDTTGLATPEQLGTTFQRAHSNRVYDPLFGSKRESRDGPRDARWRVIIDLPPEVLRGWALYEEAQ
jgi:predicted transcriptional regulator of viral defense system